MRFACILGLAMLAGAPAFAERHDRDFDRGRDHWRPAGVPPSYVLDAHHGHDRYYPPRGLEFHAVPRDAYVVRHGGVPFYFHGGIWYRSYGPRVVVVAPPLGIVVPFLPPFYTTLWFGGVPYYYADDAYYRWDDLRRGYVVVTRPADDEASQSVPRGSDETFAYPNNGQSEAQQKTDRYECYRWAVDQTGYDPTQPLGGVSREEATGKRASYKRAEAACLEGRGYTVK